MRDVCRCISRRRRFSGRSNTAAALKKQYGGNLKPIPVSAEITQYLDQKKRLDFLAHWKQTLGAR